MKLVLIAFVACILCFGVGLSWNIVGDGKGKYGLTEHTQDVKAARELYDSAVFYKADRDEQIERRIVAEHQNAQLKQQLQQYQAAVEKINDRLKKAKDITPPANTNAPTVSTNQAVNNK